MGLLTTLSRAVTTDRTASRLDRSSPEQQRAQCRNCGRRYAGQETCPACGSGNRLLAGPPPLETDD